VRDVRNWFQFHYKGFALEQRVHIVTIHNMTGTWVKNQFNLAQFRRYFLKLRINRTSGDLNASPKTQLQTKTAQIHEKKHYTD
jgi:hypothetical protein